MSAYLVNKDHIDYLVKYQSCEHDGWESSKAKAIVDALRSSAWHALPGYEDAAWGPPVPPAPAERSA